MERLNDQSVDLIISSPPYPMVEMWNTQFSQLNPEIEQLLADGQGRQAFERMHQELDKTWYEVYRVLKEGGIACINVGDATQKIGGVFQQFPNHARILGYCTNQLAFSMLPSIIWRKQSNKPNKFMGSGMLPPNAYITLEHEHILVLRKGEPRVFTPEEKHRRNKSAFFWEERNFWFSDIWFDLKGTDQSLNNSDTRLRSAAFPFELAYRLINMYSIQGDLVLDPFLGTGTTQLAAMSSCRNSVGYEIDSAMHTIIEARLKSFRTFSNEYTLQRLERHKQFIRERESIKKAMKYISNHYSFKVMTKQEEKIQFPLIKDIIKVEENRSKVIYES